MGLFKNMFGKEQKKSSCCDMKIVEVSEEADGQAEDVSNFSDDDDSSKVITVMGPGRPKCHKLNDNVRALVGKDTEKIRVDYVTDPAAMAEAGVMSTPALLVNGVVVSQGKVLTVDEIRELL